MFPGKIPTFFLTWNLSLVFYLLLVSVRVLGLGVGFFFAHPFLRYLTLAVPLMNFLTRFMQPLPHYTVLLLPTWLGTHFGHAFPPALSQPGFSPRSNISRITLPS